jgi:hypothetical protein
MRIRRVVIPLPVNRTAWIAWRKRDGRMTLPHAFRIVDGKRAARTLCHNAPGDECSEFVEARSTDERCASCDEVVRRHVPRGAAVPGSRPKRPDPRTLYEPVHRFDDWERQG